MDEETGQNKEKARNEKENLLEAIFVSLKRDSALQEHAYQWRSKQRERKGLTQSLRNKLQEAFETAPLFSTKF